MATDRTNKPLLEILEVRTEGLEGENSKVVKKVVLELQKRRVFGRKKALC